MTNHYDEEAPPRGDYDDDMTRGIPNEKIVLSCMLNSPVAVDELRPMLTSADFVLARHGLIFDAIVTLSADGRAVGAVEVSDSLGKEAHRVGGLAYLSELMTRADAIPGNVGYHADEVRNHAKRRQIKSACVRTAQAADEQGELSDVVDAFANEAITLQSVAAPTADRHVLAFQAMEALDADPGVATPWERLNHAIGGWRPGSLYIIGARPGIGKSILGMQAALDIARRDRSKSSLFFSMEMSDIELMHRVYSSIASVDNGNITRHCVTGEEYERMASASAQVAALPLEVIDEGGSMSLAEIRGKIREAKRRRPVGLVTVDYLNLVKAATTSGRADRRVQVDEIAQGLKNLARSEEVPVLALAQLNRGIEARADKMPVLSDLRESGGIEAAADVVALMHRETNEEQGDTEDLAVWLAKNRQGQQVTFHLHFEGKYSRATDRGWSPPLRSVTGDVEPPRDSRYGRD